MRQSLLAWFGSSGGDNNSDVVFTLGINAAVSLHILILLGLCKFIFFLVQIHLIFRYKPALMFSCHPITQEEFAVIGLEVPPTLLYIIVVEGPMDQHVPVGVLLGTASRWGSLLLFFLVGPSRPTYVIILWYRVQRM